MDVWSFQQSVRTPQFNNTLTCQNEWKFDNCKVTETSSLPIIPSASWEPLVFENKLSTITNPPQPNNNQPEENLPAEIVQRMLSNWDPALDEYLSLV